jgi:hypothetical protein
MIEIVNTETHAFKHLPDLQAVANFLAEAPDAGNWTGWERIAALPAATVCATDPVSQTIVTEFAAIAAAFDSLPALDAEPETAAEVEAPVAVQYGANIGIDEDGVAHELAPDDMPPEIAAQLVKPE